MKHRILMIGHGGIAHSYLQLLSGMPQVEVCGVVGRSAERAERFAFTNGIPCSGTDVGEVAMNSGATVAVVCTPNAAHREGVLEAARAGLHCLCEKPLHIDPAAQREMIDLCSKQKVVLGVSYMRRLSPHFEWLKKVMDAGELGRITVVDVRLKHFREPAYYRDTWHGKVSQDGGGPFMQQGSHIIDVALWLCGGYREVHQAKRFRLYHDIETEDHGYAVVTYRNGAIGQITASTACAGLSSEQIEVSGTRGSILANYEGITAVHVPGLRPPDTVNKLLDNSEVMLRLLENFLGSIESGQEPCVTGASAALTTEFIDEIYRISGDPISMRY